MFLLGFLFKGKMVMRFFFIGIGFRLDWYAFSDMMVV